MGTFLFIIGTMLAIIMLLVINLHGWFYSIFNNKPISKKIIIIDMLVIISFIIVGLILGIN